MTSSITSVSSFLDLPFPLGPEPFLAFLFVTVCDVNRLIVKIKYFGYSIILDVLEARTSCLHFGQALEKSDHADSGLLPRGDFRFL